jgi:hypothetical protein
MDGTRKEKKWGASPPIPSTSLWDFLYLFLRTKMWEFFQTGPTQHQVWYRLVWAEPKTITTSNILYFNNYNRIIWHRNHHICITQMESP